MATGALPSRRATLGGSSPGSPIRAAGAPLARQVADRFHLMQNLRENIEREMTSLSRCAGRPRLPAVAAIATKSYAAKAGFLAKPYSSTPKACTRPAGPSAISPLRLARIAEPSPNGSRWTICRTGNVLLSSQARLSTSRSFSRADGQRAIGAVGGFFMTSGNRGYIGSFSHLERLLSTWRKSASDQLQSP